MDSGSDCNDLWAFVGVDSSIAGLDSGLLESEIPNSLDNLDFGGDGLFDMLDLEQPQCFRDMGNFESLEMTSSFYAENNLDILGTDQPHPLPELANINVPELLTPSNLVQPLDNTFVSGDNRVVERKWPGEYYTSEIVTGFASMDLIRGGAGKRTKGFTLKPRFKYAFPGVPFVKSTVTKAQKQYRKYHSHALLQHFVQLGHSKDATWTIFCKDTKARGIQFCTFTAII
ncbi:hypothetical protein F5876DRAFT_82345 [Lentinula aff. lateritia]|uniref:Uncharacterized protein n=1 Tax=Lentinula aff. lateritia TaxID=2804960 RepID=A0ACC1TJT2_9AGAR|nr:hypothetical protein F5876DRAFT_82345 [Lentinula aff. lateritia]